MKKVCIRLIYIMFLTASSTSSSLPIERSAQKRSEFAARIGTYEADPAPRHVSWGGTSNTRAHLSTMRCRRVVEQKWLIQV